MNFIYRCNAAPLAPNSPQDNGVTPNSAKNSQRQPKFETNKSPNANAYDNAMSDLSASFTRNETADLPSEWGEHFKEIHLTPEGVLGFKNAKGTDSSFFSRGADDAEKAIFEIDHEMNLIKEIYPNLTENELPTKYWLLKNRRKQLLREKQFWEHFGDRTAQTTPNSANFSENSQKSAKNIPETPEIKALKDEKNRLLQEKSQSINETEKAQKDLEIKAIKEKIETAYRKEKLKLQIGTDNLTADLVREIEIKKRPHNHRRARRHRSRTKIKL